MKVLVTGAAGFIGSRFAHSCSQRGVSIISVDHLEYFRSRPEHQGIEFGELIDRERLFEWLNEKSPNVDGIVHLGACADTMQTDWNFLQRVNIDYSKELWDFARHRNIPMVYASSAATYGAGESGYEDDESQMNHLKPLNLYGESKRVFDLWALDQDQKEICPPAWSGFKFFNVYGMGERHKGRMASVVLHAFDQIRSQGEVQLFRSHRDGIEDGHQKRDFIFVDDVVDVLWFALTRPIRRGIYNLGTGQARTFLDLARGVFQSMNQVERIRFVDTPVEIRDKYQYFTEARMEKLRIAGYSNPFTSLETGVGKYVQELLSLTR